VSERVILAQLSDLHVCDEWEGVDPAGRVERVVAAIGSLPDPVDAVVVTGDLSDDGSEESYRRVRGLLEPLAVPTHVLPGNHDDRARLRAAFGLPGSGEEPIDYSVTLGELRLVAFDSVVPGQDPGAYEPEQLRWLDQELARDRDRPTILALHHPPLATGLPGWDAINLTAADREAMAAVIAQHPQVRAIAGGHLHRVAAGALAGRPVFSAPSACLQAMPAFAANDVSFVGPPGFALHVYFDGELSSQAQLLPGERRRNA
jgi:3',5'-cyclic AMP phosphodiesterase CpdA